MLHHRSSVSDELIWEEDHEGDSFEILRSQTNMERSMHDEQNIEEKEECKSASSTPSGSHIQ